MNLAEPVFEVPDSVAVFHIAALDFQNQHSPLGHDYEIKLGPLLVSMGRKVEGMKHHAALIECTCLEHCEDSCLGITVKTIDDGRTHLHANPPTLLTRPGRTEPRATVVACECSIRSASRDQKERRRSM